jgi:outer membrane protein OmpA-like peptidoglycan-associated protein
MDIYKINFLENIKKECVDSVNAISTIKTNLIDEANGLVRFNVTAPPAYKAVKYEWSLNSTNLNKDTNDITINVSKALVNNVLRAKTILYCDTCLEPMAVCNSVTYNFPKPEILVDNIIINKYDPELPLDYMTKDKIAALGFDLSPIHFNLNKSNVRGVDDEILNKNLEILKAHPDLAILIYGFTDARGSEKYNLTLSKKRVQHVQQYLESKGLNSKQIKLSSGKGEQFLVNDCGDGKTCDDTTHEQNRRVEFLIINNTK